MADIISGKSRFNGDRNAPVKKIININTEVAASSENDEDVLDEEVVKKKIRRHKIRGAVLILVIMMIAIAVYAVVLRVIDNYDYKSYAITNSINRDDIESSKYVAFADGYVRYSNDGISYYKSNGKVIWNQTYSMQNPAVSICGNSIAVADINGSSAYSFNADGQVGKADTSMPILQIEVSSGGKIAAVLEDTNANYINMYDTNGDKIYSVKTTLSGDGYPLDISISSDAKKLIASFIKVSGDEIKTNVVFYNFSDVGKNETERVVGGFNYDDVIVGDVKFIDDTQAVAVGENVVSIYKIKEYPSLEHTIEINNEIEKIFYSDKYIGMILDNSDSGDPYKLVVYNMSGKEVFDTTFAVQYTDIKFDGKSVVMSNSSTFVLMNMKGKVLADIDFDMPVINVLPIGNRGSYTLVNSKYIQTIRLK